MRLLLLDISGIIASIIIGITVVYFSSSFAIHNFTILLFFLLISVLVTKHRHKEKREKGLYEHERSWQNVISNGAIPALCCFGFYVSSSLSWISAFVCSIAAATGDKFGSELGVLSGRPISLKNLKFVRPGTSGAVTLIGTFMSFVGPLTVATVSYLLFKFNPLMIFAVASIGFLGAFSDSIAGIAEESGFGNKSTSNLICTLVGALLGLYFGII